MALKIVCIVGTRPEAIKMAPVIRALKAAPWAEVTVLATGQHRQILDQVLSLFDITPDIDLNVMQPNQTLPDLTGRMIAGLDECLGRLNPDAVLAQGDTTTVLAAAMAAFYRKVPFGHVEAGLRTGDMQNPFPEEMNRVVTSRLARWHFAPTQSAKANLLSENVNPRHIFVTGNTVIDTLLAVCDGKAARHAPKVSEGKKLILVTSHRRENFGEPFRDICRAIRHLADSRSDIEFMYPVHPNPNIREVAYAALGDHPRIRLCEPLDYLPFVAAMKSAHIILTDSGGVQEEAPALGKPVLVLREETERPEAVSEGVVKLVGADFNAITEEIETLLDNEAAYSRMARGTSPYGDGHAAARIVEILETDLMLGRIDNPDNRADGLAAVTTAISDAA